MKKKIKYAIGEIFLVVIGILIAVSINNWNENRKVDIRLQNIFKMVKNDMIRDTLYTHAIKRYYKYQDSLANILLQDTLTIEYLKSNSQITIIPFDNYSFEVTSSSIENLKRISYERDMVSDSTIINILQFHSYYKSLFKDLDEKIKHDVQNNTDYLKASENYFALRQKQNTSDKYLNYFLTDDFKNRVFFHQKLTARNFVNQMTDYNQTVASVITMIDEKLENYE